MIIYRFTVTRLGGYTFPYHYVLPDGFVAWRRKFRSRIESLLELPFPSFYKFT